MKAKDLIEFLSLNPDAEICAIHTQYNGDEDCSTIEDIQIVTDGDTVIISSDNIYDKQVAIDYLSAPSVKPYEIAKLAESDEPCIYID